MNRTEAHPVELAIVAALVVADALLTLVVAAVALVVVLARKTTEFVKNPADGLLANSPRQDFAETCLAQDSPFSPAADPQPHPLATLAAELQALPVTRLRAMTGTRSKSIRKAQLIAMVTACN
jgi:hypothetical protein